MGARAKVVEDAPLVGRQGVVIHGSQSHVEHARPSLLDIDDVPRGEVDERGRHGVVGHAEAVCQEVDDRRRLVAELERPPPDRRLWRRPRPKGEKRRREPEEPGPDGGKRENEISVAEQAGIVSAEADERS